MATAVIENSNDQIPIHLLSLAYDDAVLYKGTKVVDATVVDHPLCMSEIQESHKVELTDDVPKAKQQQLWEVVEKMLSDMQHHQLFALLLELGPGRLCQHNNKHNRLSKASGIIPA